MEAFQQESVLIIQWLRLLLCAVSVQDLRRVIESCWTADPEARPSFEEVVSRLEEMLKTLPKHSTYSGHSGSSCCSVQ
jgi:hypothetical protein